MPNIPDDHMITIWTMLRTGCQAKQVRLLLLECQTFVHTQKTMGKTIKYPGTVKYSLKKKWSDTLQHYSRADAATRRSASLVKSE